MERGDVRLQGLRRVALGIHGHQDHLDLLTLRSERLDDPRKLGERRRADIRAVGEPEEHHDRTTLEVRQGSGLPVVPGQFELAPEVGTGDVGRFERRTGTRRAASEHKQCREPEGKRPEKAGRRGGHSGM
jgi:hypothetical protein